MSWDSRETETIDLRDLVYWLVSHLRKTPAIQGKKLTCRELASDSPKSPMMGMWEDESEGVSNDIHGPFMTLNLLSSFDTVTVKELSHELHLSRQHHGRVLYGQFCGEFMLRSEDESEDVVTLLVDTTGDAIPVHMTTQVWLTEYTHTGATSLRLVLGKRVVIKEPFIEMSSDGMYVVRVLDPVDVILLDANGHSPAKSIDPNPMEDLQMIRREGNHFFTTENWAAAVNRYSQCIDQADDYDTVSQDDLNSVLMLAYTNRAEARLRLLHYEHALNDADEALKIDPKYFKSLVRKGRAEHGLGLFEESCKSFKAVLGQFPGDQSITKCLMASTSSLEQSRTGKYELLDYFARGCTGGVPYYADFVGPVEIRRVSYSNGGRGLFATRNVEAGELLLVSNALAKVPADQDWRKKLLAELAKRVKTSRRQMAQLYNLVRHGKQDITVPSMELFRPGSTWLPPGSENLNFDVGVIRNTLRLNSFTVADDSPCAGKLESPSIAGIWGLASFANHSCTPNTFPLLVGNAIFLRASVDIMEGEELSTTYLGGYGLLEDVECRRSNTREGWSFTCKCARCLLEESLQSHLWKIRFKMADLVLTVRTNRSYRSQLWPVGEDVANLAPGVEVVYAAKDRAKVADQVDNAIESHNSKLAPKEKNWIRATFLAAFHGKAIFAMEKDNTQSIISALEVVFDSMSCLCVSLTTLRAGTALLHTIENTYSTTDSEVYRLIRDRMLAIGRAIFGEVAVGDVPKLFNLFTST